MILSLVTFTSKPAVAAGTIIPAGTPVTLRSINDISSELANTGDSVQFAVVSDVVVNGKTVIPAGSTAIGTVLRAKKQNFAGIPAELSVQVNYITGPSGSTIPVSVSRTSEGESKMVLSIVLGVICCLLFLLMKGKSARIPAGTVLNATTTSPIEVQVWVPDNAPTEIMRS